MAFKLHRNRWKGIKWIDTSFAIPYKRRAAVANIQIRTIIAIGEAQMRMISAGSGDCIAKRVAVIEALISTAKACGDIASKAKKGPYG